MAEELTIVIHWLNRIIFTIKSFQHVKWRILFKDRILLVFEITLNWIFYRSQKTYSLSSKHWYSKWNCLLILIVGWVYKNILLAGWSYWNWNFFIFIHTNLIKLILWWAYYYFVIKFQFMKCLFWKALFIFSL